LVLLLQACQRPVISLDVPATIGRPLLSGMACLAVTGQRHALLELIAASVPEAARIPLLARRAVPVLGVDAASATTPNHFTLLQVGEAPGC
jgi:hypothetical protein